MWIPAPCAVHLGRNSDGRPALAPFVARARRLMPKVDALTISGAEHDLPVSQPEPVDELIMEFLADGRDCPAFGPNVGVC